MLNINPLKFNLKKKKKNVDVGPFWPTHISETAIGKTNLLEYSR